MQDGRVSGDIFRFLSTMHPSLTKKERARYGDIEAGTWVPWTADIAAEFSDLVKRSPRDTAFARGFAYVAQKGLPEATVVSPQELLANIDRLPSAWDGGDRGSLKGSINSERKATVILEGMTGFTNACIAVVGEITQRLQSAGATGVSVRHASPCRLQGGGQCCFNVEWTSEATPSGSKVVGVDELLGPRGEAHEPANEADGGAAQVTEKSSELSAAAKPAATPGKQGVGRADASSAKGAAGVSDKVAPPPKAPPAPGAAPTEHTTSSQPQQGSQAATSQDLFEQLRVKLLESEAKAGRHAELESRIESLNAEIASLRTNADRDLAQARAETEAVRDELSALRQSIRELLGES